MLLVVTATWGMPIKKEGAERTAELQTASLGTLVASEREGPRRDDG